MAGLVGEVRSVAAWLCVREATTDRPWQLPPQQRHTIQLPDPTQRRAIAVWCTSALIACIVLMLRGMWEPTVSTGNSVRPPARCPSSTYQFVIFLFLNVCLVCAPFSSRNSGFSQNWRISTKPDVLPQVFANDRPPLLCTHLSPSPEACHISEQAAHYHTLAL
jgi:hypothetical protein